MDSRKGSVMPDIIFLEHSREIIKCKFPEHPENMEVLTLSHTNLLSYLSTFPRLTDQKNATGGEHAHSSQLIDPGFSIYPLDKGQGKGTL